ncbi:MAG: PQQ-binding-like beta-propeller repeat protein [Halieaceae bacterium]|nr:PQQ-binding-like beta-propeller repeat protein [Halieaceae bacterium]
MKRFFGLIALLLLAALLFVGGALLWSDQPPLKTIESFAMRHADKLPLEYLGKKLFDKHCASCHDNPAMHAPSREALGGFSKESVMVALEFGKMQPMAAHLSKTERGLIAIYLAGSAPADEWIAEHRCAGPAATDATEYVANWGLGEHNRRYLPTGLAGIDSGNVASLELAWSLAFPKVTDMRSQPAIVGDTLYFGDKTGKLYAIDRQRGCVRNYTEVLSGIRSAITVATLNDGSKLLVFADSMATIYAVDPANLETVWQKAARIYETSIITGSISYHDDRLFVPVSSYEVAVSGSPSHVCCKSHGGVIALDARNGDKLWEWQGTADATLQGKNSAGADIYGPSGVSVWSTPTIDAKRKRIYFGTGENLSRPATDTSDAIIALDMDSGELAWQFQALANDVWIAACVNGGPICPTDAGGDFDFGASVILAELADGRELLLAGQKSGDVYALDTDGRLLWQQQVSNAGIGPDLHQSTTNGGVHWGMALAGERLLVAAADPERVRPLYDPKPGLHALDVASGEKLWFQPVTRGCEIAEEHKPKIGLENMRAGKKIELADQYRCSYYYGLSAAVLATDELVFSAGLDGKIRAFDIASGEVLWQAETAVPVDADNGISGHGGAIDVSGQVVADGWLYVQSGYSMFGQLPGNVLLAYRVSAAN